MFAPESQRPKRRAIPAWLLSALLHLAIIVLLPLLMTRVPHSGREPADRPVSIVLARPSAARTEYVSPAATEGDSLSAAPVANAESLPSLDDSAALLSSAIKLPSAAATAVGETRLVATPRMTVGGSTRVPNSIDAAAIRAERRARRSAAAARGPSAQLGLFGGSAAEGRSFVFLIDRSKSMGNQGLRALQAAEQELLRALDALQPKHRFQVIAYHHKCVFLKARKLLPATAEHKAALEGHVSGLAAFGATEHEMALMSALYLKPDVIFLLTDGGDPALDTGQLRRIRRLTGGRTAIHCIQFGFGPLQDGDNFLHRLADQNSGGYGYVDMSK